MSYKPSFIKYKKLSKTLCNLLSISFCIMLIIAGLSFIVAIGVRWLPDNLINNLIISNSSGKIGLSPDNIIRYEFPYRILLEINLKPILSVFFGAIFMISTLIAIILKQLVYILKNVVDNKPFIIENARKLFVIGITFILGSLVIPIAKAYVIYKIVHSFNLENISVNYSVSVELLFMGLLLILLSEIFHYGAYLQQEYDTTL